MFKIMNDNFYSNARAFVATIRAGTMTAAAHELKTTKSGVSQKVSHLETDLGLKLLDRSGRSVNATAAGQRIFDICAPMIDAALEAEARLGEGFGETLSGRVAISGPNSFLTSVIMPIVAKFTPEHPDVRIEIKASDWNVDFAAADIDLGFRIGETPKGRFIMKRLMTAKRQLCASADLLKRHPAIDCPLGLADVPCVLRHQEARSWRFIGTGKVWWRPLSRSGHSSPIPWNYRNQPPLPDSA